MERLNALNIRNRGLVTALFAYDDDFIDQGLRIITLEQALHLYLKRNGYETIVFYSTVNGFYSFEAEMLGNFLSDVNEQVSVSRMGGVQPDVVVEPAPPGHSTGRRKFTRRNRGQMPGEAPVPNVNVTRQNLNTMPDPYGRFKTRSTGDRNANVAEFPYNLRERKHLAIVVMASMDSPEFDRDQTNSLGTKLWETEQYGRQQGSDNRLIIVIPADKCRNNIMKCFSQHDHPIASVFLSGTFHNRFVMTMKIKDGNDVETVNPDATVVLSPPTAKDILRGMESARLKNGLNKPVDWLNIEDICEQLSLVSQQKLTKIMTLMETKAEYTYDAFKTEGVQKKGNDQNSLNELIGLQEVKDQIQEFINRIELRQSRGEDIKGINKHMVFYGNPGTGKTTVARIVAGIVRDLGLVTKGHLVEVSREHLVAGYVGQTAIQTRHVIDSALDGVLFIDEAYRLADGGENDFGREAINTILARMENDRHRLVVILAGYEKDMQRLYQVNEGIKSRINTELYFQDYNAEELKQIFLLLARKYYTITPEIEQLLSEMMAHVVDYKQKRYEKQEEQQAKQSGREQTPQGDNYKFGNGRWVRNLLELIEGKVAARMKFSDPSVLIPEDFIGLKMEELEGFEPGQNRHDEDNHETGLERLNNLVGLTQMKQEVTKLIKDARYAQMLQAQGKQVPQDTVSRHMVFLGNPGTGKTTVARIMADIYYELGLLQRRTIVEVDRSSLVGMFQGHTAPRVNQVFDSALGGVLFIDEAYSLVRDSRDAFGQEALDTLVKRIEDDKDKLVVIMAGYSQEMRHFIAQNSGLQSRFNTYITFADYDAAQMQQILLGIIRERGMEYTAEIEQRISQFINEALPSNSSVSGNGRWARNLADKIYDAYKVHCVDTQSTSPLLTMDVVEAAIDDFQQSQL